MENQNASVFPNFHNFLANDNLVYKIKYVIFNDIKSLFLLLFPKKRHTVSSISGSSNNKSKFG